MVSCSQIHTTEAKFHLPRLHHTIFSSLLFKFQMPATHFFCYDVCMIFNSRGRGETKSKKRTPRKHPKQRKEKSKIEAESKGRNPIKNRTSNGEKNLRVKQFQVRPNRWQNSTRGTHINRYTNSERSVKRTVQWTTSINWLYTNMGLKQELRDAGFTCKPKKRKTETHNKILSSYIYIMSYWLFSQVNIILKTTENSRRRRKHLLMRTIHILKKEVTSMVAEHISSCCSYISSLAQFLHNTQASVISQIQ